jgi:hypothetical protein
MMKKKNKQQNFWGLCLIISVVLVFIGLFGIFAYTKFSVNDITQYNVFLIDATDNLNPQQKGELLNKFNAYIDASPKNAWHEFYKVGPTESGLLVPLVKAKSAFAKEEQHNYLTANPSLLKIALKKHFEEPLKAALNEAFQSPEAKSSPILESIQSVAITCLRKPDALKTQKRLILVSNLMQNTESINFYKGIPEYKNIKSLDAFRTKLIGLEGVDFEIWLLNPRLPESEEQKLLMFWNEIINGQGAQKVKVVKIAG